MSEKTAGVLSLRHSIETTISVTGFIFRFEVGRRVSKKTLRDWIHTLRHSAEIVLKVEPFIRYKGGSINSQTNRRSGTGITVNLLREAADYLQSLPTNGRTTNFYIASCVHDLCRTYEHYTGRPHYTKVANHVLKAFPDRVKRPKRPEEWAKKLDRRWKARLKDPKAMGRVERERDRWEILDKRPVEVAIAPVINYEKTAQDKERERRSAERNRQLSADAKLGAAVRRSFPVLFNGLATDRC
jgi:hypothetical protein